MKPKRIILIRHGQSEGNVDKGIYAQKPDYTLEITAEGVQQSLQAGVQLREIVKEESVYFYVSPMWRTRGTFENIAKALDRNKIDYREEPRIREQEWGHFVAPEQNLVINSERDSYGTFYYRIPDGESAADVFDRVSDFFGTLFRDFTLDDYPENTVIITHGMTLRIFLMRWFYWTVEEFEQYSNPYNCQIVVLEMNANNHYELQTTLEQRENRNPFQRPIKL